MPAAHKLLESCSPVTSYVPAAYKLLKSCQPSSSKAPFREQTRTRKRAAAAVGSSRATARAAKLQTRRSTPKQLVPPPRTLKVVLQALWSPYDCGPCGPALKIDRTLKYRILLSRNKASLSREGVVSSHSVIATGLCSRHGSEFGTLKAARLSLGRVLSAPTVIVTGLCSRHRSEFGTLEH